jgi:hypothetical protein
VRTIRSLVFACTGLALLWPSHELLAQQPAAQDWWAYRPLQRPQPPAVKDEAWVRNEIDRFVLARLEAKGLKPAAGVDKAVLIRRLYYDLTGLPPSPEEVATFVADGAPDAYDKLVDRLLALPQYGVQWGRHWLDIVRYAETDSFERDTKKPEAWRYRDWVVDAFNEDLPYGQFLTQQLAGDELPEPTVRSMVATGYYRLGIWDDEPTDRLQAVYDDFDGIVDTTARAMLGISMGCARCHDHKKDPIKATDYYSFLAFFENMRPYNSGLDGITATVPADGALREHEAAVARFAAERKAIAERLRNSADSAYAALEPTARVELMAQADRACIASFSCERTDPKRLIDDKGGPSGEVKGQAVPVESETGTALRFDGDDRIELPLLVKDSFSITFRVRSNQHGHGRPNEMGWFSGDGLVDAEVPGVVRDFGISWQGDGRILAGTGGPETFLASPSGNNDGQWHHVAFTRDRPTGHIALYVDGTLVGEGSGNNEPLDAPPKITVGGLQPGGHGFRGDLDELRFYNRALAADEVIAEALQLRSGIVAAAAIRRQATASNRDLEALASLRRPQLTTVQVLCAREREGKPEPSFVRLRGNARSKGVEVQPALPAVLGAKTPEIVPLPEGRASGRRTALAKWITQPDNQLTWRVIANRLWQFHFGRGLCRTPNDFGRLGELPTHPELLDWLATETLARGQSLKAMHRLLVTSSTYRMSCAVDEHAASVDPTNDLFWRFDRRRLQAEEVRDSMLAASGTINLQLGGPSVYPPMPAAVLATSSRPEEAWGDSPPDQDARRSIFIHQKRSLLDPLLSAFDLADTDTSCPVRFATVQPTQALILMNGEFAQTMARTFAARLRQQGGDLKAQIERAVAIATCRAPKPADVERLLALAADLQRDFSRTEEEALARCCLVLLNSNEFAYLD